jgi:hypothetical protein
MVTQNQIMTTLAYLMGERTVPTTAVEGRRDFVQRTLEEVYRAFPWGFAAVTTPLTLTNQTADLPTDFDSQHKLYVYWMNGDEQQALTEINQGDSDMYKSGDRRFWTVSKGGGEFEIHVIDNDIQDIFVKYQQLPPVLDASTGTPFQDVNTLALGARRYVKLGENPDADISQDEALFQKRLTENIAAAQIARPLKRGRKVYFANGYRLGEN